MKVNLLVKNLWKFAAGESAPYGKQVGKTAADGAKTYLKKDTFTCVNADGSIRKTVQRIKSPNSTFYNINIPMQTDDGVVGISKTVDINKLNGIIKKLTCKTVCDKGIYRNIPIEAVNLAKTNEGVFKLRATDKSPQKGPYVDVFSSTGLGNWQYFIDGKPVERSAEFFPQLKKSGNTAQVELFLY